MLMPMVSVTIPVFRKKYDAAVKQAQLSQERHALLKEERSNMLVSEYESAWFILQSKRNC
ncbi:MAG: TolC family protein [Bacteroidales bacterium]|nr:TolC family protein [Bacteroidales bacterium]